MSKDSPGLRIIYDASLQQSINFFILFGLIAIPVTLWILSREHSLRSKFMLLIAWGILPPTWFVVEYFFIYLPHGAEGSFQFFQYGQNVASKLWAAIFGIISISLYKANEKEKEEKKQGKD